MPRNIKTFFVDGTRDLIIEGRSVTVHVIARERDFTHARIAGFAMTERDARLFAASAHMLTALKKADQNIVQLCNTANTCAEKAGLGRKVRAEDFVEEVRAAVALANTP